MDYFYKVGGLVPPPYIQDSNQRHWAALSHLHYIGGCFRIRTLVAKYPTLHQPDFLKATFYIKKDVLQRCKKQHFFL